jgi:cysteinyl-tRNA synthetase
MTIYLHNTATGKKEEFKPLKKTLLGKPIASMYHCGPTVYDYVHTGNLRAAVFTDTIRRLFDASGYKVNQVMNITDIGHLSSDADEGEDKMTKALIREKKPLTLDAMKELADFYAAAFIRDIKALNVLVPMKMPKASEHIKEDIAIIRKLESKGLVYKTHSGVYFDTSKINDYGKLGGITQADESESRIGVMTDKKHPRDFSLWKLNTAIGWQSPWGKGFPGWHIECSAMSMKYLGETFDIHTGGIEHIPIHHNNEIAQSEHASGKTFANYWLHNAHLVMSNEKMAKSIGNVVYLKTIIEKGYSPLAYRYFILGARYSTQLNFTWEALDAAETAYKRLKNSIQELPNEGSIHEDTWKKALLLASDDLDTPKVVALVWDILRDGAISPADKKATILKIDSLLGLALDKPQPKTVEEKIPQNVLDLVKERDEARKAKNFAKSDLIRDQIAKLGYEVKDTPEGQKILKK